MFNVSSEQWITVAQANNFPTGMTPAYGAVGVWTDGAVGHVAVCEDQVNNVWYVSESFYNTGGTYGSWSYSHLGSGPDYLPEELDNTWSLLGFIYPYQFMPAPPTPPIPGPKFVYKPYWRHMRRQRGGC